MLSKRSLSTTARVAPPANHNLRKAQASLVAQAVKNPPAVQETWVRSLGLEDPLEKGTATPLKYSGLENSMEFIVHGVSKSWK